MQIRIRKIHIAAFAVILAFLASYAAHAQEHADGVHHGFHDAAHWAQVFESPERAKWQKPDEVVQAMKLQPGQQVFDIGAGTGYFTRRFAKAVAPSGEAVGLDIEPAMVDYMSADAKKQGLKNYGARWSSPTTPNSCHTRPTSCSSATRYITWIAASLISGRLRPHLNRVGA